MYECKETVGATQDPNYVKPTNSDGHLIYTEYEIIHSSMEKVTKIPNWGIVV